MTPLPQKMIEVVQLRGFSIRTHQSYRAAVSALAELYGHSPGELGRDESQEYFLHRVKDRGLSPTSCWVYLNGIRLSLPRGVETRRDGGVPADPTTRTADP